MSDSSLGAVPLDLDDADIWQQLTARYSPYIRYCLRRYGILPHDADDLVQDVLTVAVRRLPALREQLSCPALLAWLRKTTHNCVRDFWRARRKFPAATGGDDVAKALQQQPARSDDLQRRWDDEHRRHLVRQLMDRVRPRVTAVTMRAFERVAVDGQSATEVAAELGVSTNAVFIAKTRVLAYMREDCGDLICC
jgi:RNA polymerase sigma-70 factor (ECF subfamily)